MASQRVRSTYCRLKLTWNGPGLACRSAGNVREIGLAAAYQHWFGRPSNLRFEPYYELPMGISKLRALVQSDLVPILCPLSRVVLPGRPSRATFAGALFAIHKLWAVSSIVCSIALISVTSGPNFLACSKMLRGACVCSCGTRTRSRSAIVSLPCCRRLRHEHNPVLISQAG